MKGIIFGFTQLLTTLAVIAVLGALFTFQQGAPPWGRVGLGWVAALLLVVIIFLVLIGVTSFAAPNILLIAFILVALALLL